MGILLPTKGVFRGKMRTELSPTHRSDFEIIQESGTAGSKTEDAQDQL